MSHCPVACMHHYMLYQATLSAADHKNLKLFIWLNTRSLRQETQFVHAHPQTIHWDSWDSAANWNPPVMQHFCVVPDIIFHIFTHFYIYLINFLLKRSSTIHLIKKTTFDLVFHFENYIIPKFYSDQITLRYEKHS